MALPLDDRRRYWEWHRSLATAGDGGGDDMAAAAMRYALPVMIGLLVVIGAIGNGAVLYVTCRHRRMKTAPNAFLAHVAFADLLVLFAVAPFVAAYYVTGDWPAGVVSCKIAESAQTLAMSLSALSVVALSIERYAAFAIAPLRRRLRGSVGVARRPRGRRGACIGLFVVWSLSLAAATPDAVSAHMELRGDGSRHCAPFSDAWGHLYPRIHTVVSLCVLFAVPLALVTIFYASLGCVVCGRKRLRRRARRRLPANGTVMAAAKPPSAAAAAAAIYGSLRAIASSPMAAGGGEVNGAPVGGCGPRLTSDHREPPTNGWGRSLSYAGPMTNGGLSNGYGSGGDANGWAPTKRAAPGDDRRKASHDRLAPTQSLPVESWSNGGHGRRGKGAATSPSSPSSPPSTHDLSEKCSSGAAARPLTQRRRTLAKVAMLLCVQFVVCWGPRYAYRAWLYFADPDGVGGSGDESLWQYVRLAGVGGVFVNAALAPFTVVALHGNFRRYLRKYLCCCCSCSACCCLDDGDRGADNSMVSRGNVGRADYCIARQSQSQGAGGTRGAGVEVDVSVDIDGYRRDAAVVSGRRGGGGGVGEQFQLATVVEAAGCGYPYPAQHVPRGATGSADSDALYGGGMRTDAVHLRRPATGDYGYLVGPAKPPRVSGNVASPYCAQSAEQPVYVDLDGRPHSLGVGGNVATPYCDQSAEQPVYVDLDGRPRGLGVGGNATNPFYAQSAEQPVYVDLDGRPFVVGGVTPHTFGTAQHLQLSNGEAFQESADTSFSRGAYEAGMPPLATYPADGSSPAAAAAAATAAAMAAAGVIVVEPEEVNENAPPGVYI